MEQAANSAVTTMNDFSEAPSTWDRLLMQVPILGDAWKQNWAEYREDTAIQRQVADMKAAGINPILAYSGGGASSSASQAFNNGPSTMQTISSALSTANANKTKKEIASDNAKLQQTIANIKTALELIKLMG